MVVTAEVWPIARVDNARRSSFADAHVLLTNIGEQPVDTLNNQQQPGLAWQSEHRAESRKMARRVLELNTELCYPRR